PYEITSFGHLRWIAANSARWDYKYIQKANISANLTSDDCYYDPSGWYPIGNSSIPFTGVYDGGGYKITGLSLNRMESFQGLFGEVRGGELKNIKVNNCHISAAHGSGALAGLVAGTVVTNCHSTGIVTVTESGTGWSSTGGLIGDVYA